jgi:ferredoxin-like protein FixX
MACMHCTDAPCAAVCPVSCFYTTADGVVRLVYNFLPEKDAKAPNTWLASKAAAMELAQTVWVTMRVAKALTCGLCALETAILPRLHSMQASESSLPAIACSESPQARR